MSSKTMLPAIAIATLCCLATVSAGFAQDAPAEHPAQAGQSMMGGTNPAPQGAGMMGSTGNKVDMMNMMRQMTRMMENCNRMMESADQNPPPSEKPAMTQTPPG